jgi:quinol monooxygenase YgiN
MIIIIGRVEADPDRLATLRQALTAMMRATWEESGCLSYSLAVEDEGGNGQPAVISIVERWEDEAALKAHFHTPHMQAFNNAITGAVLSIDVKMFDASGERPLKLAA